MKICLARAFPTRQAKAYGESVKCVVVDGVVYISITDCGRLLGFPYKRADRVRISEFLSYVKSPEVESNIEWPTEQQLWQVSIKRKTK